MRKYKEWKTSNGYGSFWDFGSYRSKIHLIWNSSNWKLDVTVSFFHTEDLKWKEIWFWEFNNISKLPNNEEFYNYEKIVCEDVIRLIDGG